MSEIQMGTIQWFPGHMTKTRRMIAANLSLVDAVVEILDARIPSSSQNPEMQRLVKEKPRMLLLNKADMADPNATARWVQYYQKQNLLALPLDCKTGKGIKQFIPMVRNQLLKPLMEKRAKAGIVGAPIRLMIVGIPNVGKSSFINRMAQSKKAKVEDRPGVLANIASVFGNSGVSLAQVIQRRKKDQYAEIVVITDEVKEKNLKDALAVAKGMSTVKEISGMIRVA